MTRAPAPGRPTTGVHTDDDIHRNDRGRLVANDGELSLREAVAKANATAAPDTINFDAVLEGTTLLLTGGELTLSQDVTIDGDGNNDGSEVTLSAGNASRLLNIAATGTDVSLRDLTLTEGRGLVVSSEYGGAILLGGGSLAMTGCTISDSYTLYEPGGGIFAADNSRLTITNSSIVGNQAFGDVGGGIATGANVALTVRDSQFFDNASYYGGGAIDLRGSLSMEDSTVSRNNGDSGGGLHLAGTATIARSTITDNHAFDNEGVGVGGGINVEGRLTLTDSTVAANTARGNLYGIGGGIAAWELVIRNSTITGNMAFGDAPYAARGGGILGLPLEIANSIIAGNTLVGTGATGDPNISAAIVTSNGHNIFGSDVAGNVAGDRENVPASAIFAAVDPATGGGQLAANGIVPLLNSIDNPALSGADPLASSATGQLGTTPRPSPAGSLPDIGAVEINQPLSTTASARNDVITGQRAPPTPSTETWATTTSRAWAATTRSTAATAPTCSMGAPATTSSMATVASTWFAMPDRRKSRSTSASPPTPPSAAARPTR